MFLCNCLIMYIFLLSWMLFDFIKMFFCDLVLLSFLCFLTVLKMGCGGVDHLYFHHILWKITIQDVLVHLKC
jgi:hypothetical protein